MHKINTETVYDAVIVGGGLAGLTVAYQLRDKNILVLEKENRFGGRARSEKVGEVTNNIGVQFFSDSEAPMVKMFDEIGVTRTHPNPKEVPMALSLKGQYYPSIMNYITPKVMWQFVKLVFRCYRKYRIFMLPLDEPRWQALVKERAKELHAGVGDELMDFFNLFLRGTCLSKPERTSAGLGAAFGAAVEQGHIAIVDGGFDDVTNRLAQYVDEKRISGAEVIEVVERDGVALVTFKYNGETVTVKARDAVIATPAPVVTSFMPELPETKRIALDSVVYGSLTIVSLILKKEVPWERFYALLSDNTIFQGVIDQTRGFEIDKESDQPIVMNFIVAPYPDDTDEIQTLLAMPHEELIEKIITDFKKVVPNSEGIETCLLDSKVTHYPIGEVELSPEYYSEMLPELEKSVGNIHFCGDYTDRLSFVDGTVRSAFKIARKLGSNFVMSEKEERKFFYPPKYGAWGMFAIAISLLLAILGCVSDGVWGTISVTAGSFSIVGTLIWPHFMPPIKQVYQLIMGSSLLLSVVLGVIYFL